MLETEIQKNKIKERTGSKCPNNEMLNTKTFYPKCQPANEYKID